MDLHDTIAAISTPRGKGGVALLRVSGDRAVEVASRVFAPACQMPLGECTPRKALYGTISAPEGAVWKPVDDGLATLFLAPSSFTGEDTVEICCHGGILLTETILSALFAAGARPATAGEFTRRAFLNGKLGLDAAEALGDLLEASSREQITLAHAGMSGRLGHALQRSYEELRRVLSSVLACIDFPEEDLAEMSRDEMEAGVRAVRADVAALAGTWKTGHAVAEGIATVICGRTNVGKSSLYNCLVGHDAAIVTDIAGTTRDILTETARLGRVTLRLCDTAGLRETGDAVEQIGIQRAERAMEEAELILAVFDLSRPLCAEEQELLEHLKTSTGAHVIGVLNKADLANEEARAVRAAVTAALPDTVELSAGTGSGLDALAALVDARFTDGTLNLSDDAIVVNARQASALNRGLGALDRALESFEAGLPVDLLCTDIEAAMEALSEMDGRAVDEDIVSEIFSHFCVGK